MLAEVIITVEELQSENSSVENISSENIYGAFVSVSRFNNMEDIEII